MSARNRINGNNNNATNNSTLDWISLRMAAPVSGVVAVRFIAYRANYGIAQTNAGLAEFELYDGATKITGLAASSTSNADAPYTAEAAVDGVAQAGTYNNWFTVGGTFNSSTGYATNARGFEALMVKPASPINLTKVRFVSTDAINPARQFREFEIQISTDPTATAGDPSDSSKWFGIDLLNGNEDNSEQSRDSLGNALPLTVGLGRSLATNASAKNRIIGNKNNATDTTVQKPVTLRFRKTQVLAARLVIYANSGAPYVHMTELELYNDEVKLTGLTGTVTKSQAGWGGSGLTDGDSSFGPTVAGTAWFTSSGKVPTAASPINAMVKASGLTEVNAIRFTCAAPDNNQYTYANAQPFDFEVQFTTNPSALVTDSPNSAKWFGLDLLNGKADGTEKAMSSDIGGSAVPLTYGAASIPSGLNALNKIVGNKNNSTSTTTAWITHRLFDAVDARAVRLIIYKNGGGATVNVSEFEFHNGAVKLTGITGSATSQHASGLYPPSKAFDGSAGSSSDNGWHSYTSPSEATPQILMGKLADLQTITHLRLLASAYDANRQPEDYEIQFSQDPSAAFDDPLDSKKWFGADLLNGKEDGTESSKNSQENTITPTAGLAFLTLPAEAVRLLAKNRIIGNKNNATDTTVQKPVTLRFPNSKILAVRIIIYANGGDGHYTELREAELWLGTKKLKGLTATATFSNGSYPPANLVDGNTSFTLGGYAYGWYSAGPPSEGTPAIVMIKAPSLVEVNAFRFMTGIPDGVTVTYPNSQPYNFEIQFTTDPTAVVSDAVTSNKWFGLNLINGNISGGERAMDADIGGSAVSLSEGNVLLNTQSIPKNRFSGNKNNSIETQEKWVTHRLEQPTNARAVRMVVYDNGIGETVSLSEFEFYSGTTKITGITGAATSALRSADEAFDGIFSASTDNGWRSQNNPSLASPQVLMGKLSAEQTISHVRFLASASEPNCHPQDYEIQFSRHPLASENDAPDSVKWFGVNLLNGDTNSDEMALGEDDLALEPSIGLTQFYFDPIFIYDTTPLIDFAEIEFQSVPKYMTIPLSNFVEVEYQANIDNGFRLIVDKLTGGVKPPASAKYRSKVFDLQGFNSRVTGVKALWDAESQDFELEVRIYVANTLAEVKAATVPAYTEFFPAFSLGENLSATNLANPLNGKYAQIEFVMHRSEGGVPSTKSMNIKEFILQTASDEFLATPIVNEATTRASTLSYLASGSAILTFNTETDNTYYSKVWGLLHRPNGTSITLATRSANAIEELDAQEWTSIPSGSNSPQVGRYVQLKIEMASENGSLTPAIPLFEMNYTQDPDHVHLPSLHKIKTDLIRYIFDTKILNQMNRSNLTAMYVDVFEDESGVDYKNGAMLVPLVQGKGYRLNGDVESAEILSITQALPAAPNRFIFSAYDKGDIEYKVSFDGGLSWISNIQKDVQINVPLEKAGSDLKIHARMLSPEAELSAWGVIF